MQAGPSRAYFPLQPDIPPVRTMRERATGFAQRIATVRNLGAAILSAAAIANGYMALTSAASVGSLLGAFGNAARDTAIAAGTMVGGAGGLLSVCTVPFALRLFRVRWEANRTNPALVAGVFALGGFGVGALAGGVLAYRGWLDRTLCPGVSQSTAAMQDVYTTHSSHDESSAQSYTLALDSARW